MPEPISPRAEALRSLLLSAAGSNHAIALANEVTDSVNEQLNAAGVTAATSLLARALIARSVAAIAADWWTDLSSQPKPITSEAIMSLVTDLPPEFDGDSYIDPSLADGQG